MCYGERGEGVGVFVLLPIRLPIHIDALVGVGVVVTYVDCATGVTVGASVGLAEALGWSTLSRRAMITSLLTTLFFHAKFMWFYVQRLSRTGEVTLMP